MKKLLIIFVLIVIASSLSANMSVRLGRLTCLSSGDVVDLPILLENDSTANLLGGFDFVVAYDSRLVFNQAFPGELLTECGWEYFTYSSPSPNSVRILALAETNNGPNHPSCFADTNGTLAYLRFQLGQGSTIINEFVSVWWHWNDCGDNSISSQDGNGLFMSDLVYYFDGGSDLNITQESVFPTVYGAPNVCITGATPAPTRSIDFYSGGIEISSTGFQIECPDDIVALNDNGSCGAVIHFDIPQNNSCVGVTSVSTPPSGSLFEVGTTMVTTVATDYYGHLDSCYFNITVKDTEPPQVLVPNDTTVYTALGQWWSQVFYSATAIDLCSGVTITSSNPSGSYFAIGKTDVVCVATDNEGNADTSTFSITVIDNEDPIIIFPDTIFLPTENAQCGTVVDFSISASDNSTQVSLVTSIESGSFFQMGTTEVSAIASDPYGNRDSCRFIVIIEDLETPQISCISSIAQSNDPGSCGAVVVFLITATDNCGIPAIDYSVNPNSFFPIGSTLVITTATDLSQNVDSCQFYVIVQDIEPPHISRLNDMIFPTDFNECGAIVDFSYIATDNCDGFETTSTHESGSFFDIGSTLVVLQVVDIAGLSDSSSFTIIIEDREKPQIEIISPINVMSDSGFYGAIVNYAPIVTDNCQLSTVTISPQSGSYFEIGENEVSITALDTHGNFDSTSFIVNVTLQDIDNDSVADFEDNCVSAPNPEQEDTNSDGIGDACCCVNIRGNIDNSSENYPADIGIDISDLVILVAFMFDASSGIVLYCPAEADFDASGEIDITDLVLIVGYMFQSSKTLPSPCQ